MAVYTSPVEKKPQPPKTGGTYTTMSASNDNLDRARKGLEIIRQQVAERTKANQQATLPTTQKTSTFADKPTVNLGGSAALNSYRDEEIRKKAENGGQLLNPTAEKQQLYDYYQNYYSGLVKSKAQTGQGLTNANTWKQGVYQNELTDMYGKEVQNEIQKQIDAYNADLARSQQANMSAVNDNNAFLQEQLGKFKQQKAVTDNQSQMLANRRGGFYSGGLDYQLGQNASSFNEQTGNLQRDIGRRNAEIYGRNALLAEAASKNIATLQQQAPDMIRQRVQAQLDKLYNRSVDEAQFTGKFNGQDTLAAQGMKFDQGVTLGQLTGMYNGSPTLANQQWQSEFGLKQQDQQLQQMQVMASLTGYLPNGQPTTDQQQRELQNLWLASEQTGVIHPTLAKLYGLPSNTPTYAARQDAIQNSLSYQRMRSSGGSGGGTSGGSSGGSGSGAWNSLKSTDQQRYVDMWNEGDVNTKRWLASQFPEIFSLNQQQPNIGDEYDWEGAMLENLATQQGIIFGKASDSQLRNVVMSIGGQEGWDSEQMNQAFNMLKKRNDSSKTDTKKKKTENKEASKKAGEKWLDQKKKSGSGGILG